MTKAAKGTLNPSALTVADVARLLSAAGGKPVSEDLVRADLAAGAPVNADGTMNLTHYTAWLAKRLLEAGQG